jgi:hypothetical protein
MRFLKERISERIQLSPHTIQTYHSNLHFQSCGIAPPGSISVNLGLPQTNDKPKTELYVSRNIEVN